MPDNMIQNRIPSFASCGHPRFSYSFLYQLAPIDLEHLRANIEEFSEWYYNRERLHPAMGYRSPRRI
jgi:hypothetical protein